MEQSIQFVDAFKGLTKNIISFFENKVFKEMGISCSELSVIKIIKESENKQLNVTELSSLLKMSKSAVSQSISKLENKKLVKRKSSSFDKKIFYIVLTDKGEQLYLKQNKKYLESIDLVYKEMGETDSLELSRLIDKLSCIINTLGKEQ